MPVIPLLSLFTADGKENASSPPFAQSVACDAEESREKKMAARTPGAGKHASRPQEFARPCFSRGFLSRHARRTKRKRDYS